MKLDEWREIDETLAAFSPQHLMMVALKIEPQSDAALLQIIGARRNDYLTEEVLVAERTLWSRIHDGRAEWVKLTRVLGDRLKKGALVLFLFSAGALATGVGRAWDAGRGPLAISAWGVLLLLAHTICAIGLAWGGRLLAQQNPRGIALSSACALLLMLELGVMVTILLSGGDPARLSAELWPLAVGICSTGLLLWIFELREVRLLLRSWGVRAACPSE